MIGRVRRSVAVALGLAGWAPAGAAVLTGAIEGVVVTQKAEPVSNVFVSYLRVPHARTDPAPPGGGATTGADGRFAFQGLMEGDHVLCVQSAPSRGYADTCEWDMNPPRVNVKAGNPVRNVRLALDKGAQLSVRVNDPDRTIPPLGKPGTGGFFRAGVRTPDGVNHAVKLRLQDQEASTFVLVVPYQRPLRLRFEGSNHAMNDGKGNPLSANSPQLQFTPTTEEKITITVGVRAAKP